MPNNSHGNQLDGSPQLTNQLEADDNSDDEIGFVVRRHKHKFPEIHSTDGDIGIAGDFPTGLLTDQHQNDSNEEANLSPVRKLKVLTSRRRRVIESDESEDEQVSLKPKLKSHDAAGEAETSPTLKEHSRLKKFDPDIFEAELSDNDSSPLPKCNDADGDSKSNSDGENSVKSEDNELERLFDFKANFGSDDDGDEHDASSIKNKRKKAKSSVSGNKNNCRKGTARASKSNALVEIHSETQRMIRESSVRLPYHQPMPLDLKAIIRNSQKKKKELDSLQHRGLQAGPAWKSPLFMQQLMRTSPLKSNLVKCPDGNDGSDDDRDDEYVPEMITCLADVKEPVESNCSDAKCNIGTKFTEDRPPLEDLSVLVSGENAEVTGKSEGKVNVEQNAGSFNLPDLNTDNKDQDFVKLRSRPCQEILSENGLKPKDLTQTCLNDSTDSEEGERSISGLSSVSLRPLLNTELKNEASSTDDVVVCGDNKSGQCKDSGLGLSEVSSGDDNSSEKIPEDVTVKESEEEEVIGPLSSGLTPRVSTMNLQIRNLKPMLRCTPSGFINLGDSPENDGVHTLMSRFLKHSTNRKRCQQELKKLTTVTKERTESGEEVLQLNSFSVTLSSEERHSAYNQVPGAQKAALQAKLAKQLATKREMARIKRDELIKLQNEDAYEEEEEEEVLTEEDDDEGGNVSDDKDEMKSCDLVMAEAEEWSEFEGTSKLGSSRSKTMVLFSDDETSLNGASTTVSQRPFQSLSQEFRPVEEEPGLSNCLMNESLASTRNSSRHSSIEDSSCGTTNNGLSRVKDSSFSSIDHIPAAQPCSSWPLSTPDISARRCSILDDSQDMLGSLMSRVSQSTPQNDSTSKFSLKGADSPDRIQFSTRIDESFDEDGELNAAKNMPAKRQLLLQQCQSDSQDMKDFMEFCSGKFVEEGQTGSAGEETLRGVFSDINQAIPCESLEDNEEYEFASRHSTISSTGSVTAFPLSQMEFFKAQKFNEDEDEVFSRKVVMSGRKRKSVIDDDDEDDGEKMQTKSEDGDDERDDDDSCQEDNDNEQEDNDNEQEDYDNETEECNYDEEFELAKEIRGRQAKAFLENEAELSGSEVESEDENEDGLDELGVCSGDEDDVGTEEDLRDQIGKVHLKKLIDKDQREIRLMKEMYFADGDLHSDGGGRVRKFRWKNAGMEGFTGSSENHSDQEEDDGADDESVWRKERHERLNFLRTLQEKDEGSELEIGRRIFRANPSISEPSLSENQPQVFNGNCPDHLKENHIFKKPVMQSARGSFLSNGQNLVKLACIGNKSDPKLGGARHSGSFVFSAQVSDSAQLDKSEPSEAKEARLSNIVPPHKKARLEKTTSLPTGSIFKLM